MTTTVAGGTVAFTCVWCGAAVTLRVTESGDELPDVHAFLAQHAACLHHDDPPPDNSDTVVLPA